jgi:tyrosyl-DNA phosphodiesterase 2
MDLANLLKSSAERRKRKKQENEIKQALSNNVGSTQTRSIQEVQPILSEAKPKIVKRKRPPSDEALIPPKKKKRPREEDSSSRVQCPLCFKRFPATIIMRHADRCASGIPDPLEDEFEPSRNKRPRSSDSNLRDSGIQQQKDSAQPPASSSLSSRKTPNSADDQLRVLTWNVWFQPVKMRERIEAIGKIIKENDPHIIFLQEVTPEIMEVTFKSEWFKKRGYKCAQNILGLLQLPYFVLVISKLQFRKPGLTHDFINSSMGRSLRLEYLKYKDITITAASTHLESPVGPWVQGGREDMFSPQRKAQLRQSFEVIGEKCLKGDFCIFGGDMNWNDVLKRKRNDGLLPLPSGWKDCWLEDPTHKGDPGYTYDAKSNAMLLGYLKNRLDRIFWKGESFSLNRVEMIGKEAIPGVMYLKKTKSTEKMLPVLPSDHYGLLAHFTINK